MYVCVCMEQYVHMCVYGTVCTYVCVWYSMYVCVCMVQYVRMCVYGTVCTYVCVWNSMYICVCMVQYVRMCVYGTVCTCVYGTVCTYVCVWNSMYVCVCVLTGALRATSFVKTQRYRTVTFCTCVEQACLTASTALLTDQLWAASKVIQWMHVRQHVCHNAIKYVRRHRCSSTGDGCDGSQRCSVSDSVE